MKPTERHKELCKLVQTQASFWANSNDIDSPTHFCDIDEEINKLGWLGTQDKADLARALQELYALINSLGK